MKAVNRENKKSQISVQFSAANVTSAVLEPDSKALFKVRKGGGGSGKDNSFIPVFITKHKFYINSLSKGSLTLFPFPTLN